MKDHPGQSILHNISSVLALWARISFACTVVLIPVSFHWTIIARPMPSLYSVYTDFLLFAVDVAMITTLILWTSSISIWHREVTLGPRHIWFPLAGLTIAGIISAVASLDPILSLYHAIRLILLFWFYLFIINEIHSVSWVLVPVSLQVVSQAVIAVAQSTKQRSLGLQIWGEHVLDPALSGISIVSANGVRLLRAYGLSDHPNILGGCLAFGMLILLSAYLYSPKPTFFLAALLPGVPALLETFSRSAWLAFLGGSSFIIAVIIKRQKWQNLKRIQWISLLSTFLLIPLLLIYARFLRARLDAENSFGTPSVEQQSIGERYLLFRSTIPIFMEHPLFGVGLGASPRALEVSVPNFPGVYQPPHLTLLDAALETGILGAGFYLTLIIIPFVIFFKNRASFFNQPITLTAIALLLSITIVGLFDYYGWLLVPGRLWQWLAWGLWAAAYNQIRSISNTLSAVKIKGMP